MTADLWLNGGPLRVFFWSVWLPFMWSLMFSTVAAPLDVVPDVLYRCRGPRHELVGPRSSELGPGRDAGSAKQPA